MELISADSLTSFYEKELAALKGGSDSEWSSSPPTPPGSTDDKKTADLFDFENSLDWNFSGTLNAGLFEGELPAQLYTHINIKAEEEKDDLWSCSVESPNQIKLENPLAFADDSCALGDSFDERYFSGLAAELFRPETCVSVDETNSELCSSEGNTVQDDSNERLDVAEVSIAASAKDLSSVGDAHNTYKHKLRNRVKRVKVEDDHNYYKISDDEIEDESEEEEGKDWMEDDKSKIVFPNSKMSRKTKGSPSEGKDNKYWERRKRNNQAAKRSREAKRDREILVAKRTAALEKENVNLKKQIRKLKADIKRTEKQMRSMI